MATILWTRAHGGLALKFRNLLTSVELPVKAWRPPSPACFLLEAEAGMTTISTTRIAPGRMVVVLRSSARPKRRIGRGG